MSEYNLQLDITSFNEVIEFFHHRTILVGFDSTEERSPSWKDMYIKSLKQIIYSDDREKIQERLWDIDLHAEQDNVFRNHEVPFPTGTIDFDPEDEYWSTGKSSPFSTSTVLWSDHRNLDEADWYLMQHYFKGVLLAEKAYSQGVLTRYTEYDYDTENFSVRCNLKFRPDGEAYSEYKKILGSDDWSYLISQNLNDNYLIQIFNQEKIHTVFLFDTCKKLLHSSSLESVPEFKKLQQIDLIVPKPEWPGFYKDRYIFSEDELIVKYTETKVGNKEWYHTFAKSGDRSFHGYGELEGLSDIDKTYSRAELVCFYNLKFYSRNFRAATNYHVELSKLT
jgi:hypothetical protein